MFSINFNLRTEHKLLKYIHWPSQGHSDSCKKFLNVLGAVHYLLQRKTNLNRREF